MPKQPIKKSPPLSPYSRGGDVITLTLESARKVHPKMSIAQMTRKHNSSDPRYKNGVYVNAEGRQRQELAARLQWQKDNLPTACGWQVSHWNEDYDLPVYRQAGFGLMRWPEGNGWLVHNHVTNRQWLMTGDRSLKDITAEFITPGPRCAVCGSANVKRYDSEWWFCEECGHYWKEGEMSSVEHDARQAAWEAANPPDDYGIEPRRLDR